MIPSTAFSPLNLVPNCLSPPTTPLFARFPDGSLHSLTFDPSLTGAHLLQFLQSHFHLPSNIWLSANGRPIRLHAPLHYIPLLPGTTIDILVRTCGGAPPDSPPHKRPRAQLRSEALPALRSFAAGPFLFWRQRVPSTELACDIARLVTRWSACGADVLSIQSSIADSLGTSADQAIEILWAG